MALSSPFEPFLGGEPTAVLREVTLVGRDLSPIIPTVRDGDDVVVFVHGFLASAGVFRPLRTELERAAGARIATFTHAPCLGVQRIAHQLGQLLNRISTGARITLVGHSLGGVVARWYVQEMGGDARVAQTVSLASPFRGLGHVPQWLVGVDLHEESSLLKQLRAGAARCAVPHTSIVAADDAVIVGVETACLGVGDVVVLPGRGHNSLLFDPAVAALLIDQVRRRPPLPVRPTPAL
jgi:triacylglycerol lipase